MNKPEYLRSKFGKSFLSKSSNYAILEIYELVLKELHNGFNYWEEEHGAEDFLRIFNDYFTDFDYSELQDDLPNWSNDQLFRFTQGIIGGYSSSLTSEGKLSSFYLITNLSLPFKLQFINSLIEIEEERNVPGHFSEVIYEDDLDFLILHFDYLLENYPSTLEVFRQISDRLKLAASTWPKALELIDMIKKSS